MNSKIFTHLTSGSIGIIAGVLVTSASQGTLLKVLIGAGVAIAPGFVISQILADSRFQPKLDEAESIRKNFESEKKRIESEKSKLTNRIKDLETATYVLNQSYQQLSSEYETLKASNASDKESLKRLPELESTLVNAQNQIIELTQTKEQYEDEWRQMEAEKEQFIASEVKKRCRQFEKAEIQRIWEESDKHTQHFLKGIDEATELMLIFKEKADGAKAVAYSVGESARKFRDEKNKHIESLNTQLECKNERIARLEQLVKGDLTEPEYLPCGFDQNGQIVNAIAEWLWNHHKIPLKVTGFDVHEGIITAGYTYSRSMPLEALVKVVEGDSSSIARSLGLYAVEKPQKLQIAEVFTVKVRRERPARKTDKGSLYRSKEDFIKYILSQPVRLRIVGEPGAGKTPSVAVLLSHILNRGFLSANEPNGQKLPYCVVESCNPLAGISVKNSNDLDFCLKWDDGKQGFKGLVKEYKFRKNSTNCEYKNQVGYIWVADEIDNTMAELTKEEAKPFKDALKDGGHVNIGVIVMGQSANVSTSKGLSIDDQKMMTNIYIDPVSIRTFLTQYGERFYSKRAVEKALATLEEIELELEEQNEIICDTAREFRIAMVTANRSPVFYQLPFFDSNKIDVNSYQKLAAESAKLLAPQQQHGVTTDSLEVLSNIASAEPGAGAGATPTQVSCPRCAGTTKRNGKTSTGVQKYVCKNENCKHRFTD